VWFVAPAGAASSVFLMFGLPVETWRFGLRGATLKLTPVTLSREKRRPSIRRRAWRTWRDIMIVAAIAALLAAAITVAVRIVIENLIF
jgi:hypothetical protein